DGPDLESDPAARALGLDKNIGTIAGGKAADLAVWELESLAELGYWIGLPGPERRVFAGVDA
ncbi:MAG: amidohydrolase family protein, partial [Sphingomicrobium sp.]